MATETLEPETEVAAEANPDVIPFERPDSDPRSVEVGAPEAERHAAAEPEHHEVARVENEGMTAIVRPTSPAPPARTTKQKLDDADLAQQIEEATIEVCQAEETAAEKWSTANVLHKQASDAKKGAEAADDNLRHAVKRLRKLREGLFPDGDKYPMFDKPIAGSDPRKAEVNAMFPAPEAIQPLPADTEEEFFRRKRRDTKLADIGLTPKIVEILAEAGFHAIIDLDKLAEAHADYTTIKTASGSITEPRAERLRDKITDAALAWGKEWDEAHPKVSAEPEATPEPEAEVAVQPEAEPVAEGEPVAEIPADGVTE